MNINMNKQSVISTSDKHTCEYIKIILIGNGSVGKTCIGMRYANNMFSTSYIATIGVDFQVKNVKHDGKDVKLQIWDCAGQSRFKSITKSYYRGAHVIILVYDITDTKSFEAVTDWIDAIKNNADEYVQKILIGNKTDLGKGKRVVTYEMGKNLAEKLKIPFFECSAKTGYQINEIFEEAIALTFKMYYQKRKNMETIKLETRREKEKCWC